MQRASLAISCLALFVALGGPSQAQKLTKAIKKDEVKTQHIRNGHVISGDLKDGGVKSIDIKDKAVGTADLADGAVTTAQIAPQSVRGHHIDDGTLFASDIAAAAGSGNHDFGNIQGHDCAVQLEDAPGAGAGDQPIVTPTQGVAPASDPLLVYALQGGVNSFYLVVCNLSNAAFNPPVIGYRYVVLEHL